MPIVAAGQSSGLSRYTHLHPSGDSGLGEGNHGVFRMTDDATINAHPRTTMRAHKQAVAKPLSILERRAADSGGACKRRMAHSFSARLLRFRARGGHWLGHQRGGSPWQPGTEPCRAVAETPSTAGTNRDNSRATVPWPGHRRETSGTTAGPWPEHHCFPFGH